MPRLRHLSALLCVICLQACAKPMPIATFQHPPAALVEPLPADPVVPEVATDTAVGQYIVELRSWARVARTRFDALAGWAK